MKRFLYRGNKITHAFDVLPGSITSRTAGVASFDAPSLDKTTWPEARRSLVLYITIPQKLRATFDEASPALRQAFASLLTSLSAINAADKDGKFEACRIGIEAHNPINEEQAKLRSDLLACWPQSR